MDKFLPIDLNLFYRRWPGKYKQPSARYCGKRTVRCLLPQWAKGIENIGSCISVETGDYSIIHYPNNDV